MGGSDERGCGRGDGGRPVGMTLKPDADAGGEPWTEGPRFADLPAPDSGRPRAFAIAVCVELAVVLANHGDVFVATLLTGLAGFLFIWKRLASLQAKARDGAARPALGASAAAVVAMLILIPLLLARFVRMDGGVETRAQAATGRMRQKATPPIHTGESFCSQLRTRARSYRRFRWSETCCGRGRRSHW